VTWRHKRSAPGCRGGSGGEARRPNGQVAKGVSGNLSGRPKLASVFRLHLEAELQRATDSGDSTRLQELCRKLVDDALAGNHHAQRYVLERIAPPTVFIDQTNRQGMTGPEVTNVLTAMREDFIRTGKMPSPAEDDFDL